ncbi:MAG TPA: thiamine pyrophosphate-dependent enzyme, partial [Dehalococcoidia bacterium]|nr:thiamine pyrophosphate-dependent enzyme [Dehalococcoidia bacterium]
LPMVLRRAFKVAAEPPQGPVFLSMPIDVLDQEADMHIVPTTYVDCRSRPSEDTVRRAAEMLLGAQNPLIVVGDGVAVSGAQDEVAQLAEATGARIMSAFASEMNVRTDHPLYAGMLLVISGEAMRAQLEGVDLLFAIGTPVFTQLFPTAGMLLPEGMRLMQLDLDSWEIAKNFPVDLGMQADPREGLRAIITAVQARRSSEVGAVAQERAAQLAAVREQMDLMAREALERQWNQTPISVARLMKQLADVVPEGTIVFDESITSSGALQRYFTFTEPGSLFRARGGGLGPGMPGTIGVKLARPDRPVVGVVGDGAALYTIQSLWSAAHHKVNVTWVICNNQSYRILKINMLQYLGEAGRGRQFVAMDLTDPGINFAHVAESFGVRGWRVEDPDELEPALRSAIALDGPALVDVVIDGSLGPLLG